MLERKLYTLTGCKMADDDGPGSIEGYGSVTGNLDRTAEIVERGAYYNLPGLIKDGALLVGHMWESSGVGTLANAFEDDRGLFFKADFYEDDESQRVRLKAKNRMERGKSVAFSIGYQVRKSSREERNGEMVRILKELEVFEISLVTVPANPLALAVGVKGAHSSFEDQTEGVLTALKELTERAEQIKALRETDGRKWSEVNQSRVEALAAETKGLLSQLTAINDGGVKLATAEEIAQVQEAIVREMGRTLTLHSR